VTYLAAPFSGVWDYTIFTLEASLDRAGMGRTRNLPSPIAVIAARALAKAGLVRNLRQRQERAYFAPIMALSEFRLVPVAYRYETIVYAFDCWPSAYDRWEAFFRRHNSRLALFTARLSADYFRGKVPGLETVWTPEATDPAAYDPGRTLVDRSIDVLELGRRDRDFHAAVTPVLAAAGHTHMYEREPGEIIFRTRESLVEGLANSRISVCFPSSITHPERSGNVETVTHRYFESMAARCVLLGRCPRELSDLFGYNPVVEIEGASDVLEVIGSIASHQPLVDRNYARLLQVGTWDVRVREILEVLAVRGYRI
jgi:hypothetical protein